MGPFYDSLFFEGQQRTKSHTQLSEIESAFLPNLGNKTTLGMIFTTVGFRLQHHQQCTGFIAKQTPRQHTHLDLAQPDPEAAKARRSLKKACFFVEMGTQT